MVYKNALQEDYTPRVAAKRARKMQEILGIALDLACENGLGNMTLHTLARRMDRSVAAVYRYFPSKEAVVRELQRLVGTHITLLTQEATQAFEQSAAQQNIPESISLLAQILLSAKVYETYARTKPDEFDLITHHLSTAFYKLPEKDAGLVFDVTRINLEALASRFDAAAEKGLLHAGDAKGRSMMFWGALQGVLQVQKMERSAPDFFTSKELPNTTLDALLIGWGAKPSSVEATRTLLEKQPSTKSKRDLRHLLEDTSH